MKRLRVPGQPGFVEATPRPVSPADGILDAGLGEELKEIGIAEADAGAPDDWKILARHAVERVARRHARFTTDMVWVELGLTNKPREPRALGPIMRQLWREEMIRATAEYELTAQPSRHRAPVRIWESSIYRPGS